MGTGMGARPEMPQGEGGQFGAKEGGKIGTKPFPSGAEGHTLGPLGCQNTVRTFACAPLDLRPLLGML